MSKPTTLGRIKSGRRGDTKQGAARSIKVMFYRRGCGWRGCQISRHFYGILSVVRALNDGVNGFVHNEEVESVAAMVPSGRSIKREKKRNMQSKNLGWFQDIFGVASAIPIPVK